MIPIFWLWLFWLAALSPIWCAFLWRIWEWSIRPRFIPEREINGLAEELIARHGPRAGEIALIEEGRAWRCSDTFAQGKWRRVRREIGRLHEAGGRYGSESRDR